MGIKAQLCAFRGVRYMSKFKLKSVEDLISEGFKFNKHGNLTSGDIALEAQDFIHLGTVVDEENPLSTVECLVDEFIEDKEEFTDTVRIYLLKSGLVVFTTKGSEHHSNLLNNDVKDVTSEF